MCVLKSSMPLRVVAAFWPFSFDLVRLRACSIRSRSFVLDLVSMFRRSFEQKRNNISFIFFTFTSNCYYCSHVYSFSKRSIALELCQTCSIRCSSCCFTLSPYYSTRIGYMIWSFSPSAPVSLHLTSMRILNLILVFSLHHSTISF